jgi:hypothetical protein
MRRVSPTKTVTGNRGTTSARRQSAGTGSVRTVTGSGSGTASRGSLRLLRVVAAVVLTVHGLVHLMGAALLWQWGEPGGLRYGDVRPEAGSTAALVVGAVWLVAVLLFLLTAALLAADRAAWRPIGLLAALVSIAVLLPSAGIAWAGLVVDAAVVVSVVLAVAAAHRSRRSPASGRNL